MQTLGGREFQLEGSATKIERRSNTRRVMDTLIELLMSD